MQFGGNSRNKCRGQGSLDQAALGGQRTVNRHPNSGSQLRRRPICRSMNCSRSSTPCSCLAIVRSSSRRSCRWWQEQQQWQCYEEQLPASDAPDCVPEAAANRAGRQHLCTFASPLFHADLHATTRLFRPEVPLVQVPYRLPLRRLLFFLHRILLVFAVQLNTQQHHAHLRSSSAGASRSAAAGVEQGSHG